MTVIESDWSEQEKREYARYSVTFYLEAYDQRTEALLGHVVDISLGGIKVLSQQPIAVHQQLTLILKAALETGKQCQVKATAHCVWSREDDNQGYYLAGFKFFSLSKESKELINTIISELQ